LMLVPLIHIRIHILPVHLSHITITVAIIKHRPTSSHHLIDLLKLLIKLFSIE